MIDRIVKTGRCSFCGTCFSICPNRAIKFVRTEKNFRFFSISSKCTQCGLCLEVCPGNSPNFKELNRFIFGRIPENFLLGNFNRCYVGYSKDTKVRFNASSGGTVTSLLVYLLRAQVIDGALVVGMNTENPLEPKVVVAYNQEQILLAMGSKYIPVPLNAGLREVLKTKNKKFAVVGLPCQIQGIRKFQEINSPLNAKIVVCLGLFCGQTVNFTGTRFLLKYFKIDLADVKQIKYRGHGWPGEMTIKTSRQNLSYSLSEFYNFFSSGFFVPPRCFFCMDFTNELADISFGDAWIPEIMQKEKIGKNIVVARTRMGEKILRQAKEFITLQEIKEEVILKAFWWRFFSKKRLNSRISKLGKFLGIDSPKYDLNFAKTKGLYNLILFFYFINSVISDRFHKLIIRIPRPFWKLYLKIYQFAYSAFRRFKKQG